MVETRFMRQTYNSDIHIILTLKNKSGMNIILNMMLHSSSMYFLNRLCSFWVMMEAHMMTLVNIKAEMLMYMDFF